GVRELLDPRRLPPLGRGGGAPPAPPPFGRWLSCPPRRHPYHTLIHGPFGGTVMRARCWLLSSALLAALSAGCSSKSGSPPTPDDNKNETLQSSDDPNVN